MARKKMVTFYRWDQYENRVIEDREEKSSNQWSMGSWNSLWTGKWLTKEGLLRCVEEAMKSQIALNTKQIDCLRDSIKACEETILAVAAEKGK